MVGHSTGCVLYILSLVLQYVSYNWIYILYFYLDLHQVRLGIYCTYRHTIYSPKGSSLITVYDARFIQTETRMLHTCKSHSVKFSLLLSCAREGKLVGTV
jgi:hypothetical protein